MERKNLDPKQIILEINRLLAELSSAVGAKKKTKSNSIGLQDRNSTRLHVGPSGGLKMLITENFFREPKSLPETVRRLHQEGFNYSRQVISVALLRLVRSRVLSRREAEGRQGKEKWVYAERK